MVASTKLLHLLEAFSTPWFLYASPTNHHLVFFLLGVFNNIIQYQFDGSYVIFMTQLRNFVTDATFLCIREADEVTFIKLYVYCTFQCNIELRIGQN